MTNSSKVGGGAKGAAAKDVCDALGYAKTDKAVREHVTKVDVLKLHVYFQRKLKDGTMGVQRKMEMLFVNESGF